jgi:hypothetical protein
MTAVRASQRPPTNTRNESVALIVGGVAGIVGMISAFAFLQISQLALFGQGSVGYLAAWTCTVVGIPAFAFGYVRAARLDPVRRAWHREHPIRASINTAALTLTGAFVTYLLAAGLFYVFQAAFRGMLVQRSSGFVIVAVTAAVAGYMLFTIASNVTTETISTLLTLFLFTGVLGSMLTAQDPRWWQVNFSFLGSGYGDPLSAMAFNVTITLSGVVLTTMADYLTRDLYEIMALSNIERPARRVNVIRILIMVIGVAFMFVGLFPVDKLLILHNIGAQGLFIGFGLLVILVPILTKVFSRGFQITSFVFAGLTLWAVLLFQPFGYYNLTGLEIMAIALVFVWLILFVRTTAALKQDVRLEEAQELGL